MCSNNDTIYDTLKTNKNKSRDCGGQVYYTRELSGADDRT